MMFESHRDLQNFRYNPDSDVEFQAYKDRLGRESQSAQNQTYSNLTGMSGGRNNSWASAAVGQVGQAYVQKGNDAVSDFADREYNRLAQRFRS